MKTLTYYGAANFNEYLVTGRVVTWTTGQTQSMDDSIAAKLVAYSASFTYASEDPEFIPARVKKDPNGNVTAILNDDGTDASIGYALKPFQIWTDESTVLDAFDTLTGTTFGASQTNSIVGGHINCVGDGTNATILATRTTTENTAPTSFEVMGVVIDRKNGGASCNSIQLGYGRNASINTKSISDTAGTLFRAGKRFVCANIAKDTSYSSVQALANGVFTMSPRLTQVSPFTAEVNFGAQIRNCKGRSRVIFSFDDSQGTHYSVAYPKLKAYGWPGTLYVCKNFVGTAGKLTIQQINEMYTAGWDVGLNTTSDVSITSFASDALLKDDILAARKYSADNNWWRGMNHMALSNGAWSEVRLQALESVGVKTARSVIPGQLNARYGYLSLAMTLPSQGANSSTTAQSVIDYINDQLLIGGDVRIHLHELIGDADTPTATSWYATKFQTVLDYLKPLSDAGVLDVTTESAAYADVVDIAAPA